MLYMDYKVPREDIVHIFYHRRRCYVECIFRTIHECR